jgi:hypothetical protein
MTEKAIGEYEFGGTNKQSDYSEVKKFTRIRSANLFCLPWVHYSLNERYFSRFIDMFGVNPECLLATFATGEESGRRHFVCVAAQCSTTSTK